MTEPPTTDLRSADGTRLRVHELGPPHGPVVVLVHGLGLSAASWTSVADALSDRFRVLTYDLRGHGHSGDAAGDDYRMEAHAADLDAVLRHALPDGGGGVVVGHSLGGGIILVHAARSGVDRVAAAVFVGSGGSAVTAPGFPAHGAPEPVRRAMRRWLLRVLRAAAAIGKRLRPLQPLTHRAGRRLVFPSDASAEVVGRVTDDFLATRRRALARSLLAVLRNDGVEHAAELAVPTLVLRGSLDPEVPEDDAQRLLDGLPRGELVEIEGAVHMLPQTRPDLVVDQVRRWADDHVRVEPAAPSPDS